MEIARHYLSGVSSTFDPLQPKKAMNGAQDPLLNEEDHPRKG